MSSAMMTRMFGFCACCAIAVGPASAMKIRASSQTVVVLVLIVRATLIAGSLKDMDRFRFNAGLRTVKAAGHFRPAGQVCVRVSRRSRSFSSDRRTVRHDSLVAAVSGIRFFDLIKYLAEVVALGRLQRRELFVACQVLLPQALADRQHVPVVLHGR